MAEPYKGLTLNEYLDDEPEPNRPGQRENTNFKAIIDAITTDSLNPTDMTSSQGKVAIHSSTGNAVSIVIDTAIPLNTPVTLATINPAIPTPTYTGVKGLLHVYASNLNGLGESAFFLFGFYTVCGASQGVQREIDPAATNIWVNYDAGEGSNKFCITASYGSDGTAATIQCINRYPTYSDATIIADLTYSPVDVVI